MAKTKTVMKRRKSWAVLSRAVLALSLLPSILAPAQAFNAPRPISPDDFFNLNGSERSSTTESPMPSNKRDNTSRGAGFKSDTESQSGAGFGATSVPSLESKSDGHSESESGVDSGSTSGTSSEPKPGAGSKSQSDAGSGSKSGEDSGTKSGPGSGSKSGAGSKSKSDEGSKSKSGETSKSKSGAGSGSTSSDGSGSTSAAGSTKTVPLLQGSVALTVTQALNEGLLNSPRVAAARAQLEISKALYTEAAMMPNPTFIRDEGAIAEQTRRVGVQAIIQAPWKVALRLLAAKRQVQQTKLEILSTLWQFRNDLRRVYTELVVAEQTFQTVEDLASLARRLERITQQRFSAGDVPELDVMKARLATAQTDIELEQVRRRVARAKQQLNVMLGRQLDGALTVSRLPVVDFSKDSSQLLPDFAKRVPPLRDFVELAGANRLELRLTKQAIALSQAQLYSAVGNIIPDPSIATGDSASNNPATGPKLNGIFVTLNIELPIYSFQQGEIARLRATIIQLQRQMRAQENQILGEVSQAYNTMMAARERIRVYQSRVLAESEEVVRLARRSYEVGQSDITSTLAAQQANVQIRSQYLDAVAAYQQAFTDLEQASGEPLQ